MATPGAGLMPLFEALVEAIAAGDSRAALRLLAESPELALVKADVGATRQAARPFFFDRIQHYLYAGDTALHIAAAAYQVEIMRRLIASGSNVDAKNRRGAEPLHYAVDGSPGSATWNPAAQGDAIALLITCGANPNAIDAGGVTPLHRAVRNRCAAAAGALLDRGADVMRRTNSGSTPMDLARRATGRGGSGSPAAKAEQEQIVRLLEQHGAPQSP